MRSYSIDINADVGEGIGNESKLMPYLSSCNIACGGHAGDLNTMTKVIQLAKKHNVKIGAHPSFPDRANFGRLEMKLSDKELEKSLKQQIETLQNVLHSENAQLNHIKPHGALYNLAAKDEETASLIIKVIKCISRPVKLFAPYQSVIADLARKADIEVVYEAFADRNYNTDLSLISRVKSNALISDKNIILKHVLAIVKDKKVVTTSGVEVPIKVSTLCVHGDTKNAVEILKYLSLELPKNHINIQ
jgi:UPF0271 protein